MAKHIDVLQFPGEPVHRDELSARMEILGTSQTLLSCSLTSMREVGADNRQIAHILRDAADVLDRAEHP